MEEGKDYWGNLPVPCKGVAAQNSFAPHSNTHLFSNKRPYSVSVIGLLEYVNIEINRGPSSFNYSLKASRQKRRSLSLSIFMLLWNRSSFKRKILS